MVVERTYAVRRPLVVGFLIDSGLTVLLKDAMFRTCPNIPWLSRGLPSATARVKHSTIILTSIDETTERSKDGEKEDARVLEETFDTRWASKLSSSLGQSIVTSTCRSMHVGEGVDYVLKSLMIVVQKWILSGGSGGAPQILYSSNDCRRARYMDLRHL